MSDYHFEEFSAIQNSCQYKYFQLYINGKCQFEDFKREVKANAIYKKQYMQILTLMENISDRHQLTSQKFRQIKGVGRNDVYEFKSKNLRVYVIKKTPDMYIILGGYKVDQDKDIKLINRKLKDLNIL